VRFDGDALAFALLVVVAGLVLETSLVSRFFAGADGAGLRAGVLVLAVAARFAVTALLGAAPFLTVFFAGAAGLDGLAGFLTLLLAELAVFDFVALRAGACSAGERLTIGLGRADLPVNARFLAEDVVEVRREAGLEGDRFTPFTVGSLMRSSQLSKKPLRKAQAAT
jgi:hypothetical protein